MSTGVIDLLEVVQIYVGQAQRTPIAARALSFLLRALEECAAIGQIGKHIAAGKFLLGLEQRVPALTQRLLHLDLLGNVLRVSQDVRACTFILNQPVLTVWLLAVLSSATAIQRVVHIYRIAES